MKTTAWIDNMALETANKYGNCTDKEWSQNIIYYLRFAKIGHVGGTYILGCCCRHEIDQKSENVDHVEMCDIEIGISIKYILDYWYQYGTKVKWCNNLCEDEIFTLE